MDLLSFEIVLVLTAQGSTLVVIIYVYRRQIMVTKVDPCALSVNPFNANHEYTVFI